MELVQKYPIKKLKSNNKRREKRLEKRLIKLRKDIDLIKLDGNN
jgi:hypothetical protein